MVTKWPNVVEAQVEFWKNKEIVGFGWVKRKEIAHPESNYREEYQKIVTTHIKLYKLNKKSRRIEAIRELVPTLLNTLPNLHLKVIDARGFKGNKPKYLVKFGKTLINGEEYEITVFQNNASGRLQVNAYNKKKKELIRICIHQTNIA